MSSRRTISQRSLFTHVWFLPDNPGRPPACRTSDINGLYDVSTARLGHIYGDRTQQQDSHQRIDRH